MTIANYEGSEEDFQGGTLVNLQTRMTEIGRLRTGDKVGNRPNKLDKFRFTSGLKGVADAVAAEYGGTVNSWKNGTNEEWEVYTDKSSIEVTLAPGTVLSQSYESWTAGGCTHRCNGEVDQITGQYCYCGVNMRHQQNGTKLTTRLSVMLDKLPFAGLVRLESHGYYAAVELAGAVRLIQGLLAAGHSVPCSLMLQKRTSKSNGQTRQYVVPVLIVMQSPVQLRQALTATPQPAAVEAAPQEPSHPALTGELRVLHEASGFDPNDPMGLDEEDRGGPVNTGSGVATQQRKVAAPKSAPTGNVKNVGGAGVTKAQLGQLGRLRRDLFIKMVRKGKDQVAEFDETSFRDWLEAGYGVRSTKELSSGAAGQAVLALQKMVEERERTKAPSSGAAIKQAGQTAQVNEPTAHQLTYFLELKEKLKMTKEEYDALWSEAGVTGFHELNPGVAAFALEHLNKRLNKQYAEEEDNPFMDIVEGEVVE